MSERVGARFLSQMEQGVFASETLHSPLGASAVQLGQRLQFTIFGMESPSLIEEATGLVLGISPALTTKKSIGQNDAASHGADIHLLLGQQEGKLKSDEAAQSPSLRGKLVVRRRAVFCLLQDCWKYFTF